MEIVYSVYPIIQSYSPQMETVKLANIFSIPEIHKCTAVYIDIYIYEHEWFYMPYIIIIFN